MLGVATEPSQVASAYLHARRECDSLPRTDALRAKMDALLDEVAQALQRLDRGPRPAVPHRAKFLHMLKSPVQPLRQAAYDAVDALLDAGWPPAPAMSNDERQRKRRRKQKEVRAAAAGEAAATAMDVVEATTGARAGRYAKNKRFCEARHRHSGYR